MSGSQHGFQSSFANSQQAAMRSQFVGGPGSQIPGLMAPNQQAGEFDFIVPVSYTHLDVYKRQTYYL